MIMWTQFFNVNIVFTLRTIIYSPKAIGVAVLMTDNSTSEFDARLGLISSTDKAFGLKWTERKKKKIFQVQSNVKTNQSLSKGAGMKTGLLFASKCNNAKDKSELLCRNRSITEKCLAAAPPRADES